MTDAAFLTTWALPAVFVLPLIAAVITFIIGAGWVSRVIGLLVPIVVFIFAVFLIVATAEGEVLVSQIAGWPGGIAIAFVGDLFSALMLATSAVLVFTCLVFAYFAGLGIDRWFVPAVSIMTAGVYGAFVTGDLFNLFVMVEVALLPSYVLMSRSGVLTALRSARLYLIINLTASTLFLAGLGLVYGVTGTVNLAALAGLGVFPVVGVAVGVIMIAMMLKAALVPAHSWLPATYPYTSPAVTALFSGLLTKIGAYAIVRIIAVVYEPDQLLTVIVITVCLVSMIVGVLGALGERTIRGTFTFQMVSGMGYILVGVVLAGAIGMAAVVFYLIHHMIVMTSLFLTGGTVEHEEGTGFIRRLGGLAKAHPVASLAFLMGALSLVGLPPFSGFWAKFGVLTAAVDAKAVIVVVVILVVSAGTLVAMLKLGSGVFWGLPKGEQADESTPSDVTMDPEGLAARAGATGTAVDVAAAVDAPPVTVWRPLLVVPGLALALVSLGIGLFPEWLLELTNTAGESLNDPATYISAVLEGGSQ
jgi:multicomponent Na+:H+ antiporter subunit D